METIISPPPIKKAADLLGVPTMASVCNVSIQSVYKWLRKGSLPRTEWTGETDYATTIAAALEGKVTRTELLQRPALLSADAEQALKT